MSDDNVQRSLPANELDMQLMITNSCWGRPEVSPELKQRLMKYYATTDDHGQLMKDDAGNIIVDKGSLWGLLGFYTRDMRLANLSEFNNELQTCRYMIDLANDYLSENMVEPFMISLGRAVTILETSQSKGGFLRKQMNTLTQKSVNQNMDPPKKGFWGGKNKEGGL
jgi:hypothetical protein